MNLTSAIDEDMISVNALKTARRLKEHGFEAYLVGGCVRDILLGMSPKDFDVATNAHPDQVRGLFRNSRIIGRRFKIVHVRFGREVVEVTTFRGHHQDQYDKNHTKTGMTVSDNVYGTFEEDVVRRDFTMNSLYYDPASKELIDLAGGGADITARVIRTIGDPHKRFREDPVRMLRAIRFRAKLGFDLSLETKDAMKDLGRMIQDVAAARLFEEVLKLFFCGNANSVFRDMRAYNLFEWMFPEAADSLTDTKAERFVELAMANTDKRIAADKPVTPAFILAVILWRPYIAEKARLEDQGAIPAEASDEAAESVIGRQRLHTSIPRRFSGPMRDIWSMQPRLAVRHGNKPDVLMQSNRFRAAYDFLLLREESGEDLQNLGDWWTEYQDANEQRRAEMKRAFSKKRKKPRRQARASQ